MRIINSEDGWLPKTMWVIGETTENKFVLLGAHPEWQKGWFDSGSGAAGPDNHEINSDNLGKIKKNKKE